MTMRQSLLLSLIWSFTSVACFAQSMTGFPAFGSFQNGQIDSVNENNLNVHLQIPIFYKPGRGLPVNLQLTYDSSDWSVFWNATTQKSQWQFTQGWGGSVLSTVGLISDPGTPLQVCPTSKVYLPTFTDPMGTVHGFQGYVYPPGKLWGYHHRYP